MNQIIIEGDSGQSGTYLLWMLARRETSVSFGRFQGGRPIAIPAGWYAYVGSAMGQRGASALAGRLLRHATRTGGRPPHAIRDALAAECVRAGLGAPGLRPPATKRLHWHIDYLLDEIEVEIVRIMTIRAAARLESALARQLSAIPGVVPLAPGLGASDARGESHLLRCSDPDTPGRLVAVIAALAQPAG